VNCDNITDYAVTINTIKIWVYINGGFSKRIDSTIFK
jgi:hypothetical protein